MDESGNKGKSLHDVFVAFANQGTSINKGKKVENIKMTSRQFSKLCVDSNLIDKKKKKKILQKCCDIIFIKSIPKGKKYADFQMFKEALGFVALKKYDQKDPKAAYSMVVSMVITADISMTGTTNTQDVQLHDDKSKYTGVYAKGGPKSVTTDNSLKQLVGRGKADARGVLLDEK